MFESDFDHNSRDQNVPFQFQKQILDTGQAKIEANDKDSFYKEEISLKWFDPETDKLLARMTINSNGFRSLTQKINDQIVTLNFNPMLGFASIVINNSDDHQKFYIKGEKQYEFCETLFNWIILEHKKNSN